MDVYYEELAEVLRATRNLLALPENDFTWSSWNNAGEALREMDGLLKAVESGTPPDWRRASLLFAPTGPIQEVSISSGWASQFLAAADRFDAVERGYRKGRSK